MQKLFYRRNKCCNKHEKQMIWHALGQGPANTCSEHIIANRQVHEAEREVEAAGLAVCSSGFAPTFASGLAASLGLESIPIREYQMGNTYIYIYINIYTYLYININIYIYIYIYTYIYIYSYDELVLDVHMRMYICVYSLLPEQMQNVT